VKRSDFLGRVSAALGRWGPTTPPPLPEPPGGEVVSPSTADLAHEALVARFAERASAIGVTVHRVQEAEVVTRLGEVVAALGGSVCPDADPLARAAAVASGRPLAGPADADVGVTGSWRAVAETGTVVLRSEGGRLEGLLPPVHVVVVHEDAVRAGLRDVYVDLAGAPPTALVQVTGPSRTADIELTLTTGVHGPGTVVVVLVAP